MNPEALVCFLIAAYNPCSYQWTNKYYKFLKKRHSERRKYNLQINKNNLANIRHLHGNGASVWYDCHSNPNLSFIK